MSDGGMTPSQFQILREDFQALRLEFQAGIRELVTRETFSDERRRVDGRFKDQADDISTLKRDLAAEVQARTTAEQATLQAQVALANERERDRRGRMWQWLFIIASPVAVIIVGILAANAGLGGAP